MTTADRSIASQIVNAQRGSSGQGHPNRGCVSFAWRSGRPLRPALIEGVIACAYCRPDTELGMLDAYMSGRLRDDMWSYGRAMRRVSSSRCRWAWASVRRRETVTLYIAVPLVLLALFYAATGVAAVTRGWMLPMNRRRVHAPRVYGWGQLMVAFALC
jgi:hypothetical protein